jgi:hypothetical protein
MLQTFAKVDPGVKLLELLLPELEVNALKIQEYVGAFCVIF